MVWVSLLVALSRAHFYLKVVGSKFMRKIAGANNQVVKLSGDRSVMVQEYTYRTAMNVAKDLKKILGRLKEQGVLQQFSEGSEGLDPINLAEVVLDLISEEESAFTRALVLATVTDAGEYVVLDEKAFTSDSSDLLIDDVVGLAKAVYEVNFKGSGSLGKLFAQALPKKKSEETTDEEALPTNEPMDAEEGKEVPKKAKKKTDSDQS